jgi:type IV pilus assembly protein PilC
MVKFKYRAVDQAGKRVEGIMAARDTGALEALLQKDGLWLVEAKEGSEFADDKKKKGGKNQRRHLIMFSIHMSSLLSAGVQVSPAIRGLAEQTKDPEFKKVIEAVWKRLETGVPLHEALKEHPQFFPEEIANMIQAGEESGKLADTFGEIRRYLEWVERMVGDIRQATIYPTIIVTGLILFMILLFTFVIPRFAKVLVSLNVELPLPTIIIMNMSDIMVAGIWVWAPLVVIIPVAIWLGKQSDRMAYLIDEYKLKLPVFGEIIQMLALSRFAQNFGVLFRSGVPMLRCLKLCQQLVGNKVIERALRETERAVAEGVPLSTCLGRYSVFPPLVLQMVTVGESASKLGETLKNVADYYNEEIPRQMKRVFGIMEPMITLVLIILLGFVAVSIFLPMMSLVGGIR